MAEQSSNATSGPVVLAISGMGCNGCVAAVTRALTAVPGVVDTQVDLACGRATVSGTARPEDLIRALEAAGYGGRLA